MRWPRLFVAVGLKPAERGWPRTWRVPRIAMVYGAFATLPILLLSDLLGWLIVLSVRSSPPTHPACRCSW